MNFISYILETSPGTEFAYYIPVVVFIAVLVIGAMCMRHLYKARKKTDIAFRRLFKNTTKNLVIFIIIFTVLLLARYENIPYFSMRLWMFATGLAFIIIFLRAVKRYTKDYPKLKGNINQREAVEKEKS